MSDVPRERVVVPDEDKWSADRIAGLKCVRRESGAWCHVFLDGSHICQCEVRDLSEYSRMILK